MKHCKKRIIPGGHPFGNAHRLLGYNIYMTDIDLMTSMVNRKVVSISGENKTFCEYLTRSINNNGVIEKDVMTIAIIECKASEKAVNYGPPIEIYLHICRCLTDSQRFLCRFFYVIGYKPRWVMREINIYSGHPECEVIIPDGSEASMKAAWHDNGLYEHRMQADVFIKQ